MDALSIVLKEFQTLYTQLSLKLTDPKAPGNQLSRKSISQLSSKIYPLLQGKQGQQNKDIFLKVFSTHATNYLNNHLVVILVRSPDQNTFLTLASEGWQQYQRFLFTYHALLVHAHNYYQKQSVNAHQHLSPTKNIPQQKFTIMPVAALGLKVFRQLVLNRFQNRFERGILQLLSQERQKPTPQDDRIRTLLMMYWSCSLRELARVKMTKEGVITFWKEKSKNIIGVLKNDSKNQQLFKDLILNSLATESARYYERLYWNQLRQLHINEFIQHLDELCKREEEFAEFHLPSEQAVRFFLDCIRGALLSDIEGILNKQKGFKHLFLKCDEHLSEVLPQALLYFSILKRIEQKSVPLVCSILSQAIAQKGEEITSKLSKSKQYITSMLGFKKSVRRIFDLAQTRYLTIQKTMQKQFRKLMQPLECTKALAEYSDFTTKECVRLKLDEQSCELKFRDILFLLSSVSAKDSFLLHYQEYLARRLLDSVNEPRTDIENIMVRLLGEQIGNIAVAHHQNMIKDIDKSIQASQQLHDRLPFVTYKWDLRVFNPTVWPESATKQKYAHIQPPKSIKNHSSMIEELYHQHFGVTLKLRLDRGTSLFQGKYSSFKVRFQGQNSYLFLLLHLSEQPEGKSTMDHLKTLFVTKKDQKNPTLHNIIQVLLEFKLVVRQQKEGPFDPEEIISLNYNYKPPSNFKPQIPLIIKPSPALLKLFAQSNIDQARILKEREKLIDAMLVKLLKHANSTKGNRISFQELYQGIHSNNFLSTLNIPQSVVKQRLEYLIVKQFCSRDEEDRKIYHYIA